MRKISMILACSYLVLVSANLANAVDRTGSKSVGKKPNFTDHDLNVAVKVAEEIISKWNRLETNLVGSGITVKKNTPSHGQLINSYPTPEALEFGKSALIANRASLYLVQRHCLQSNIYLSDCLKAISEKSLSVTPLGEKCAAQFAVTNCSGSSFKYRTYDGSCNHQSNPTWGKSLTPYGRLIPAQYLNGVNEPRKSVSRKPLPSPRLISNVLISDFDGQEKATTLAFVQWTQFIANDLFHTPTSKMLHMSNSIECCNNNGKNLNPRYLHPECLPISIPSDDPDYSTQRTICMNYVRSLTSLGNECNFGPANQMNQATHFLDGSMIYGSTMATVIALRAMRDGKLLTTVVDGSELLPESDTPEENCQNDDGNVCFKSGDPRVNLHPHQTVMYTIWVREHNRIAKSLSKINPHWDDNVLFEEARRIVIAEIQHITYGHWIPLVLGRKNIENSDLIVKPKGFGNLYSEKVNPVVSNSFATTALMFMNSMFQSRLRLYDDKGHNSKSSLLLKDYFNKPSILRESKTFEKLLRGLGFEISQKMDPSFIKDVTNFLFRGSSVMGQDVASLDIQRSRDHGLPGYNAFRKYCNMSSTDKFETFLDSMSLLNLKKLKSVYGHPDDVDLLVGAIFEIPLPGSRLGPVFQCLIKEQLTRTRRGDSFFYDVGGRGHSFKEAQINEIKRVTLARIICDNVETVGKIQMDVFNVPSNGNPLEECKGDGSSIPKLNLAPWKVTN